MEFSKQEYWSEKSFPSPGDLPKPGIKPGSPALKADSLLSEPHKFLSCVNDSISQSKEKEETFSGNWAILNVLSQNKVKFRSQWISAGLKGRYAYPITSGISNHLHWLPAHHRILHTRIFQQKQEGYDWYFQNLGLKNKRILVQKKLWNSHLTFLTEEKYQGNKICKGQMSETGRERTGSPCVFQALNISTFYLSWGHYVTQQPHSSIV